MSVFGTRHFGKVSIVPNLFYVATKFFHINFVPLIPLGSSVIIANSERHESGNKKLFSSQNKSILSWKSFFMAYLRLILWVTLLILQCLCSQSNCCICCRRRASLKAGRTDPWASNSLRPKLPRMLPQRLPLLSRCICHSAPQSPARSARWELGQVAWFPGSGGSRAS